MSVSDRVTNYSEPIPRRVDEPDVEIADGEPTDDERQRFEDEIVAIVADVLVRQRTIAA